MILNIFGPSGSGKTTLIKNLLRTNKLQTFYKKYVFNYQIKKNKIFKTSLSLIPLPLYRGKINEFLEIYNLTPDNFDNLKPELYKLTKSIMINKLENNLKTFFNRDLETLSAGEMRRFFILKCLLLEADILIIDEPFSNSDNSLMKTIFEAIKIYENTIILSHLPIEKFFELEKSIISLNIKNL
tara:strand:- start:8182 stop:8733 length:552 start_codon:yes stop_codon:yes gene_type:complete